MIRIVIAPDSFKECASAAEVARALAEGLRRVFPEAELVEIPLADGGEGTVDVLVAATGGRKVEAEVSGPLGEPVRAAYGLLGDGRTAVIEMAAASGLHLVERERRDPLRASTRGTGELMRDALGRGVRRLIIGLGGSATNDGGAGMAQALGFSLRDQAGRELPPGGAALKSLATIDASRKLAALDNCEVLAACDVTNPLCGPQGASRVYGPQKGATPAAVEELDAALRHYGEVVERELCVDVLERPGAGAAGGFGAGLLAFARGQLRPGFELVAEACHLAERLHGADLLLTGEGALDFQTVNGKVPIGAARLAKAQRIPVVAIAGTLGRDYQLLYRHGIDAAFSICNRPLTLAEALRDARPLLADAAESVGRLWGAARGLL